MGNWGKLHLLRGLRGIVKLRFVFEHVHEHNMGIRNVGVIRLLSEQVSDTIFLLDKSLLLRTDRERKIKHR